MRKRKKQPMGESGRDKAWVLTTVQGCEATFVKHKSHTSLFFGGFDEDSKNAEFLASYGSQDPEFVYGLLAQLANVSPRARKVWLDGYDEAPDVDALKSIAAGIRALEPRDPLEAVTCAQMQVAHLLAMMFAGQLCRDLYYVEIESGELSSTRMLRMYTALANALDRHRGVADWNLGDHKALMAAVRSNGTAQKSASQTSLRFEGKGLDGKCVGSIGAGYGLNDPDFVSSLFGHLTRLGIRERYSLDTCLPFARAFVTGMAPRDAFEAQICAQIVVAHSYAIFFANRLTQAEGPAEMASAERSLNRFLRTFCIQTEAFDRHRQHNSRRISARTSAASARAIVSDIFDGAKARTVHQNGTKMSGEPHGRTSA